MTRYESREGRHTNTSDLESTEERPRMSQRPKNIQSFCSLALGGGLVLCSLMPHLRRSVIGNLFAGMGGLFLGREIVEGGLSMRGAGLSDRLMDTGRFGRRKIDSRYAIKVQESEIVDREAGDLYRYWRHFENFPLIMKHVESVRVLNDKLSHWTIKTVSGGPSIEWDAEIISEVEDERIGWRTLPGSDVDHAGSVIFEPMPDGRGTLVTVNLQYIPPVGRLGSALAQVFRQDPERTIKEDLRLFRKRMEFQGEHTTPSRDVILGREKD